MAVDVHIGAVETELTAADPQLILTPEVLAEVARMVKAELDQEREDQERREADRVPAERPLGRRL